MENNKYRDFKGQTWTKFNDAIKGKKLFLYGYGEIGKNILENIHKYDSKWPIVGVIDKAEAGSRTRNGGRSIYRYLPG